MWFFFFSSIRLIRMSWNVSYFWTLSIFSSYSLLEEWNKNMISASYYCWFREFFFFFFDDCCQIIFGDLLRFWQRCQTLTLFDSVLRDNMVSQRWYLCLGRLPFCLSPWLSGWSHSPVSLISPTPLTWCPGFIKPSALTLSLSVCCCCCLISVLCVYASWLQFFFPKPVNLELSLIPVCATCGSCSCPLWQPACLSLGGSTALGFTFIPKMPSSWLDVFPVITGFVFQEWFIRDAAPRVVSKLQCASHDWLWCKYLPLCSNLGLEKEEKKS